MTPYTVSVWRDGAPVLAESEARVYTVEATPGPWTAHPETERVSAHVTGPDGRELCAVYGPSWDERSANADLIARAPTLAAENAEMRAVLALAMAALQATIDNDDAAMADTRFDGLGERARALLT